MTINKLAIRKIAHSLQLRAIKSTERFTGQQSDAYHNGRYDAAGKVIAIIDGFTREDGHDIVEAKGAIERQLQQFIDTSDYTGDYHVESPLAMLAHDYSRGRANASREMMRDIFNIFY